MVCTGCSNNAPVPEDSQASTIASSINVETSSSSVEAVRLTETYMNEDEGFSFKYPHDWTIVDGSEFGEGGVVALFAPKESDYSANISLFKSYYESEIEFQEGVISFLEQTSYKYDGKPL